jgi:hypothetical protein
MARSRSSTGVELLFVKTASTIGNLEDARHREALVRIQGYHRPTIEPLRRESKSADQWPGDRFDPCSKVAMVVGRLVHSCAFQLLYSLMLLLFFLVGNT